MDQSLLHQASQKRPAVCCVRLHMQTEPQQARDCAPCWLQGLGKTAQSIATLAFQAQFLGMLGPHIVIAPLTTLGHWKREIQTWTDMVGSQSLLFLPHMKQGLHEELRLQIALVPHRQPSIEILLEALHILLHSSPHGPRHRWMLPADD